MLLQALCNRYAARWLYTYTCMHAEIEIGSIPAPHTCSVFLHTAGREGGREGGREEGGKGGREGEGGREGGRKGGGRASKSGLMQHHALHIVKLQYVGIYVHMMHIYSNIYQQYTNVLILVHLHTHTHTCTTYVRTCITCMLYVL